MKRVHRFTRLLIAFLGVLGACAVAWASLLETERVTVPAGPKIPNAPTALRPDGPDEGTVGRIAYRNVMRPSRTRPRVPFDPVGHQAPAVPRAPMPRIVVLGVLLGTPRAVVLSGLPGVSGSQLVEEGDSLGEVSVVRITPDSVTLVAGADTLRFPTPGGPGGS